MLRNELEYRNAKKQIEYLRTELEKRNPVTTKEASQIVADALEMKIEDIEREIAEYEDLKEGLVSALDIDSFDDIGELIIKARIARNWSQADLAKALDMDQQQVQRYERNDWQKISLWRLQEVVEALDLDVVVHARLRDPGDQDIEPSQNIFSYGGSYPAVTIGLGLGVGETLDDFVVSVDETLANASMGISDAFEIPLIKISDAAYGKPRVDNAPQMALEGDWGTSGSASEPRFFRLRTGAGISVITSNLREAGSGKQLREAHA
jgi:transcriptional regulator with XRE-family HTH domain